MSLQNDNLKIAFVGWVDALRRDDLAAVERHLHPEVVWKGLRSDLICRNREAVLQNLRDNAGWLPDVGGIELHADHDQVMLGVHSADLVDIAGEPLDSQVFDVFTMVDELIVSIDEYRTREEAIDAMLSRKAESRPEESSPQRAPDVPIDELIPFVHVADVARSVGFYELLGFAVAGRHPPAGQLDWAAMDSGGARLMFARATEPVQARAQAVLFYVYTRDLPRLQAHLRAHGHRAGAIRDGSPGPRAEMRVVDPDGYVLMIAQRDEEPEPPAVPTGRWDEPRSAGRSVDAVASSGSPVHDEGVAQLRAPLDPSALRRATGKRRAAGGARLCGDLRGDR